MPTSKDVVFISHANPDDNEFTRWLSLKLASLGYRVWSDVTRLLGGEDFWRDIETAIRENTFKFLYVLSKASNQREGSLLELKVAHDVRKKENLHDFIIPLHLDDLSFNEINIQLANLIGSLINRELSAPPTSLRPGETADGTWHGVAEYAHPPTSREICEFAKVSFLATSPEVHDGVWPVKSTGGVRQQAWRRVARDEPACDGWPHVSTQRGSVDLGDGPAGTRHIAGRSSARRTWQLESEAE